MGVKHIGFNIRITNAPHPVPSKSQPSRFEAKLNRILRDSKGEYEQFVGSVYGINEVEALNNSTETFSELMEKELQGSR